jgi:hypothetical protein
MFSAGSLESGMNLAFYDRKATAKRSMLIFDDKKPIRPVYKGGIT